MKHYLFIVFLSFSPFCYSQIYTDFIGAGHNQDVIVSSSDTQSEAEASIDGKGLELDIQGASRFLAHTSFGPTIDEIKYLTEVGMEAWIDEQFQIPSSAYFETTRDIILLLYDQCMATFGDECPNNFNLNTQQWRYAWWHTTMTSPDKLRQRMALALSEILVISDQSELGNLPHGIASYYDILSNHAFGNYRDLLFDVTMNISMGFYLSHLNNPRTIAELNIHPDENYAREIMQLFSIGLYELNIDGTRKTDPETGLWISTYDNDDIKGLAKVFTGLSGAVWASNDGTMIPAEFGYPIYSYAVSIPMTMYPLWHEQGPKTIIGGYTIPGGQTGMEDIEEALDVLFQHPNVGPFLARRLIQRFVKSNPTPAYIQRVAEVFNDNGEGVRGDLAAMLKQILLDEEALACYWQHEMSNGALREPILRLTQLLHGLKARTLSEWFWNSGFYFQEFAGQHPMSSPTVFNFFVPDYVPDSEFAYYNMVGPEYQILNSATSSNYVNFMFFACMQEYLNQRFGIDLPNVLNEPLFIPYFEDQELFAARLSDPLWMELSAYPEELVDYLDIVLANGNLSEETRASIVSTIQREDLFNQFDAAHYALYMIMIHPDYLIMK